MSSNCDEWISLNVGGKIFVTTRTTLCSKEPESIFLCMFDAEVAKKGELEYKWANHRDKDGAYLIDRSPTYFEPILSYLRHGQLIIDPNVNIKGVLEEAEYFGLHDLADLIKERIQLDHSDDYSSMSRREVVKILMSTPYSPSIQLRFQGINLSGSDLSHLDFRNANFKHADLSRAKLTGANLSHCNFERANLSGANLDGAQLIAVKMGGCTLDNASMKGCNFEDPLQTVAILEGASLKYATLEGSQMCNINLRVACLKNANLRNCELRSAVLAGADLENCDLSGSDLQEANLRGANFKGAAFELMLTPLHMSQAVN